MKKHRGTLLILILVAAAAVLFAAPAEARHYVSFMGDFYFSYPDDWVQVDHRIVDAHLIQNKAGETTLDYEAAFAPVESVPFFAGPYFILTVDTTGGGYTDAEIDSAVTAMGGKFGRKVKYFPVADFLADLKSNAPAYDEEMQTISVVNDIVEQGEIIKKHLLVMKFFEQGVATFYFYAPVDAFEQAEGVFNEVLASFHSGDVDAVLPKEDVTVAEVDFEDSDGGGASGGVSPVLIIVIIVVLLVLVVAVIAGRMKKKSA